MSTGSGGKPPSGSSPGSTTAVARPPADTPQRLIVRSLDRDAGDSMSGMNDTAVASNAKEAGNHAESGTSMTMSAERPGGGGEVSDIVGTTLSGRYLVTR